MNRRTFLKLSVAASSYLFNTPLLFGKEKSFDIYEKEFRVIYGDPNRHGVFVERGTKWDVWANRGVVFRETQIYQDEEIKDNIPDNNPRGDNRRASYSQMMYQKDRILYPMKKSNDSWIRIDWDEAVSEIAKRLAVNFKPIVYAGGGVVSKKIRYDSMESLRRELSAVAIKQNKRDYEINRCDYKEIYESDLVLFWGANPLVTDLSNAHYISEGRYRGLKVVTISVDFSNTSKISDLWVPADKIEDRALLKEMILHALKKRRDEIEIDDLKSSDVFGEFDTLEDVEKFIKSDLKSRKREKELAKKLVVDILSKNRKSIVLGHHFDRDFILLIKLFSTICKIPYSFSDCNCFYMQNEESKEDGFFDAKEIFEENSPKMAIIAGDNLFRKNGKSFKKSFLENIEFFVYMDVRFNEMARYADILLPVKGDYEMKNIDQGTYPPSNLKEIAEAKGEDEIVSLIKDKLKELKSSSQESVYDENGGDNWNFTSVYTSKRSNRVKKGKFPFRLYMRRSKWSYNSTFRTSEFLLRMQRGEPFVLISKKDAENLGIKDNETVSIYNENAHIVIKTKISDSPSRKSLIIEHGWESFMFKDFNAPNLLFGENSQNSTEVGIKKVSL